MFFEILLVTVAVVWSRAEGADYSYSSDSSRPSSSSSYATPSPAPHTPEPPYHAAAPAESKSYKEDDRRPYNDGPSPRTGPPKKIGPGPFSYSSHGLPLSYPQRFLQPGPVIGYLAYPQPLVHSGLPLHESAGILPSAAFSHIAYASPITLSQFPKAVPLVPGPGPSYSSGGPSYSSGGPSYSSSGPSHSPGGPSYSSSGPSYSSGPHSSYNN